MEAEGGIERVRLRPYTALQTVNLKLFLYLINRLHGESGNPLCEHRHHFPTSLVSTQPDQFDGCLLGPEERRLAMTWAQQLKRVFTKSSRFRRHRSERCPIETCTHCGGHAKVVADTSDRCIEDQQIIDKILSHLKKKDRLPSLPNALPETRAPPQTTLFHG